MNLRNTMDWRVYYGVEDIPEEAWQNYHGFMFKRQLEQVKSAKTVIVKQTAKAVESRLWHNLFAFGLIFGALVCTGLAYRAVAGW